MRTKFLLIAMGALFLGLGIQHLQAQVPVIIDQDMSSDHDDVADLAVLNAMMNLGQCNILACISDSQNSGTPLCMSAINTYYGHPNIPCGLSPNAQGSGGYPGQIATQWPHPLYQTSAQCPNAVTLYRQILAAQPNNSVVIITTGFFTSLADLLLSGADQYSSLTGSQLVAQKVKLLSCSAGIFPTGGEFNLDDSGDDSSYVVLNNWPTPILYTGFDVGEAYWPEGQLQQTPLNSPVRAAWSLTTPMGNSWTYPCWGQVADYNAVRSVEAAVMWGQNTIGYNTVAQVSATQSGADTWHYTGTPGQYNQSYLLETEHFPGTEAINALVMQAPPGVSSVPGQPSDLRATVANSSTINLQWASNSYNETGFEIDRGINGVYTKIGTAGTGVTTYSDTGLSSTKNISYRVLAYNAIGNSPYTYIWVYSGWTETNFQSASDPYPTYPLYTYYQTCDLEPYIATSNNQAAAVATGAVNPLAAPPCNYNHVTVCNDSTHGQDVAISVDEGSYGTEGSYYIYFFYQDANDWYRLNVSGSATKFEKDIAGTITQIGASGAGISTSVTMQHWKVVVSHTGTLQFITYGNVLDYLDAATTVLNVTDTLSYTTGKIGLGGYGGSGYWQNFHFELTSGGTAGTAPAAPTALTAVSTTTTDPTGAGYGEINLSWTPSLGATAYNIYQGTSAGGESATPVGVNFNGTAYTVPYVNYGTAYYYKVVAVNSFGVSGNSNEAHATPTNGSAMPAITSSLTASATVGSAFSYQITGSNTPTSYNATGLPAGLSVNTTTGAITGTPTTAGTSSVTISAINASGTGTATLVLTVNAASTRPTITSSLTASATVGTAFSYQITGSNTPMSYNATGLPAGLSVNTSTGAITGTPSAAGMSNVNISATNASGTGTATLALTVNSSGGGGGNLVSNGTYKVVVQSSGLALAAAGTSNGSLVEQLTYTGAATQQWVVNNLGSNVVEMTVSGTSEALDVPGSSTATVGLDVASYTGGTNQQWTLTSSGVTGYYEIINFNSGLEANVEYNSLTSGTPICQYTVGNASNEIWSFTSASTGSAPVITSGTSASGTVGTAFSYQIAASNTPTGYNATGLPAGLTVSTSTGAISGTPTAAGTSNVTISATNASGTGSATLVLTVNAASAPPVISSSLTASATVGTAFSYQIAASNTPTGYNATGLPAGLTVSTSTGAISGTPTAAGTSNVTISATNASGTGSATLVLTVSSAGGGGGNVISNGTYKIVADNSGLAMSAIGTSNGSAIEQLAYTGTATQQWALTNLSNNVVTLELTGTAQALDVPGSATSPVGLDVASYTGGTNQQWTITPSGISTYYEILNVNSGEAANVSYNSTASGTAIIQYGAGNAANEIWSFTSVSGSSAPAITSSTAASGTVGSAFSYIITATNSPTSYNATGLPLGLTVNTSTGAITGTPSVAGTSNVTLSATNAYGPGSATLALTIVSNVSPPVITSGTSASGTAGSAFSYQITGSNTPTSYNATGLPAGLSVNTTTGAITGTPTTAGTSSVTISATNAGGTGTATLVLTVNAANTRPAITSSLTASATVGSAFSYMITATNSPTSYNATGLPLGLTVNTSTGAITGTPSVAGTSNVTLSATNAYGPGSATLTLTVNASSGSNLIANGNYRIVADNSSLSMASSGTASGSSVVQQTYTAATTQQWTLTNLGNNSVVKLINIGAGAALDVPGSATSPVGLDVANYTGGTNQQWTITASGTTGYYEILNVNSGYGANVSYNSTSPGTAIIQYGPSNAPNEIWAFLLP